MSGQETSAVELDAELDDQSGDEREHPGDEREPSNDRSESSTDLESSDHTHTTVRATDPAPQCAGCHRRGIELTLLENGKRYCERCADEVERLMGIGPLFPAASGPLRDSRSASAASDTGDSRASNGKTSTTPLESAELSEVSEGSEVSEVARPDRQEEAPPDRPPDPANEADDPVDESSDAKMSVDIATVVARSNREALEAATARSITPTTTSDEAVEERELMQRVEDQSPPAIVVSSSSSPPGDLTGLLAAEQARLLEQRAVIEAQFRADLDAIDERLVHVESLLGDDRQSLAS